MAVAKMTCVTKSQNEFELSQHNGPSMIAAKGQATLHDDVPIIDLVIQLDCVAEEQSPMKFNSVLRLHSGNSIWVARDFDGEEGLDLKISCDLVLLDGTPGRDAVLIQKGDSSQPWVVDHQEMTKHRVGNKGWLLSKCIDPGAIQSIWINESDQTADPFAETKPESRPTSHRFAEVEVPEILKAWFDGSVLDLRDTMRNAGVDLKDGVDFRRLLSLAAKNIHVF